MTSAHRPQGLVLGLYPDSRGFGWVAFEGPANPHQWGLAKARGDKNPACLRRIEKLLSDLNPEIVVLEAFEQRNSARTDRIARLCRAIVALAMNHGIECEIYTRRDVEACFASVGAITRQEIAEAVARHVTVLESELPEKRKPWAGEHRRMALFGAAALVLTHYSGQ